MLQQSEYETVHILYDDMTKHYEYFRKDIGEEGTWEGPRQNRENKEKELHGIWAEESKGEQMKEGEKIKEIKIETSRYTQVEEGTTLKRNRV
eukprot:393896-Pleurochrysis_carterae.AAC.2